MRTVLFSVQEYPDYFEMEISESEQSMYSMEGQFSFEGEFYLLNSKQISL